MCWMIRGHVTFAGVLETFLVQVSLACQFIFDETGDSTSMWSGILVKIFLSVGNWILHTWKPTSSKQIHIQGIQRLERIDFTPFVCLEFDNIQHLYRESTNVTISLWWCLQFSNGTMLSGIPAQASAPGSSWSKTVKPKHQQWRRTDQSTSWYLSS